MREVTIQRTMIPAWENALIGRWDHAADGSGPKSLSRGAAFVDSLVSQAKTWMEQDLSLSGVAYSQEYVTAQLQSEEDGADCFRALITLRGEAGQIHQLAQRAGL